MRNTNRVVLLTGSTLLAAYPALAQEPKAGQVAGRVFYAAYVGVPPVAVDQAQVVYYRNKEGLQRSGAAHVYIDREFHTGLLPGGFTSFCLAPGSHTLGAYLDDAPSYKGKHTDLYLANLEGGRTYYLKVREDGNTFPMPIKREEAERELQATRSQMHALSRATSVETCRYYEYLKDDERFKHYSLASDVLFAYGKSDYRDISVAGRNAIGQLLGELQRDGAQIQQVQVTGHTDPFGTVADNQLLGERRANTVRQMLIDGGIAESILSTSSAGSREPVVHTCYGPRVEQISCYAPNRRVAIRVELNRSQP
ncbi:OmpA family protein [Pseudomonas chlororaphis]|uniref:OmpA family protein n=1 Tax=Pseudomonas chlororaphis TaxID=587753 RepID=UPI0013DDB0F4|nr:OmpA family protein [Pseudomonas chlororaphis]